MNLGSASEKLLSPKPHVKYCNIIFDLNGVLIEYDPMTYIQAFFTSEEQPHIFKLLTNPIALQWDKDDDRGIATLDDLMAAINVSCEKEKIFRFFDVLSQWLLPIPQGLDWFNRAHAKGYKIYILSNYPKNLYEAIAAKHEFFKRAHGQVISYQVKKIKPETDIYHELLTKYDLQPQECLFIDDKKENILAGQAIGIDGIVCGDHCVVDQELKSRFIF